MPVMGRMGACLIVPPYPHLISRIYAIMYDDRSDCAMISWVGRNCMLNVPMKTGHAAGTCYSVMKHRSGGFFTIVFMFLHILYVYTHKYNCECMSK